MENSLKHRFEYHPPDEAKIDLHSKIRGTCYIAANYLDSILPECKEKSLALTKIEEAMFWSNAALARS